ncbi:DUF6804 family protein [Leifsonia sp. TF02-11]|uniref:DUF6804 family protein n=1 Tax=Leifsonia sp. TF02-11 TaxID=2815212 RepID=UPI001AA19813|nr:DUF6804 family protein [Leifsonia sp. TF02-11]MBO1740990.1 hypothetical protein [Leifsonia sp. TF02-11]
MPYTPQPPAYNRAALAPGLIGALALLFGLGLEPWYVWVQYAVCVLALILCVFAWQAKRRWWLVGLIPIAVLWNPIWPIPGLAPALAVLSLAAAVVFVVAGLTIKIPADTRR